MADELQQLEREKWWRGAEEWSDEQRKVRNERAPVCGCGSSGRPSAGAVVESLII